MSDTKNYKAERDQFAGILADLTQTLHDFNAADCLCCARPTIRGTHLGYHAGSCRIASVLVSARDPGGRVPHEAVVDALATDEQAAEWARNASFAVGLDRAVAGKSPEPAPAPSMRNGACDLVFVDVETGGLSPDTSDIIEIAAIRRRPDGTQVGRYEARVLPARQPEAQAARVNGYDAATWEGLDIEAALRMMLTVLRLDRSGDGENQHVVMVGHNVSFDEKFVRAAFDKCGIKWPFDYHKIDTVSLAWPLFAAGKINRLKLEAVCDYYGISNAGAHGAMVDVERCMAVYDRLMAEVHVGAGA
jgi:DNA polymerase-3 subunit epsilon